MKRREFIKTGAAIGAAFVGGLADGRGAQAPGGGVPDLAVVKGADSLAAARKALDAIGGARKFIPRGSKVGLLINAPSWWRRPGSFTHPDVVLAALLACQEAGAASVQYLIDPAADYWTRTPRAASYKAEIGAVRKCSGNFVDVDIPKGLKARKSRIIREFLECDLFINLPLIKNHAGVGMSGNLKNLMGVNSGESNRFFHVGGGAKDEYADAPFLAQCIADLNTLRKPALCLADATEVLLTNGPQGPGELGRPGTVIAGTDPVAVDACGAPLVRLKADEVLMLRDAAALGLGSSALDKLKIRNLAL